MDTLGWADFRNMEPEPIKDILLYAASQINASQLPPFLVLDDINFKKTTSFEREFIAFVFSVINANGMVIITGTVQPPRHLLPKLHKNETCEVSVPYFDEAEIAEMARVHGLSDDKNVSAWARTIWVTTSGHPQLVHARVRNLKANGWPTIKLSDILNPNDVEEIRLDTQIRLVEELPNENARILIYRLSLIHGSFTREIATAIAEPTPPIKLAGEVFDALVGPWIEKQGKNRYRISPLLTGAAQNNLLESEKKAVHGAIALSILGRKSIDQFEVGTAFFHAFMAKHKQALLKLAETIITTDSTNIHFLYDAMNWFTLAYLEDEQKILPDNPSIDVMLRLAQFKLITHSPEPDKALVVIERIEEALKKIEPLEFKQHTEALAYGAILNTLDVPIPSSMVIRMLSRLIDIEQENSFFQEISDSFKKGRIGIPSVGENKPVQLLFSFQANRLSGLDDLSNLITSLDALPENKRDQLLGVCDSDMDFASLLINGAWWKELDNGELDVNKALQILELTIIKSRNWKVPKLIKACLVAMSVIQDEYGHSTESALEILDIADNEFPNEVNLINQRAKILFRAKRNLEALPIANQVLKLSGLSDVEFIFCCRATGIAAAEFDNWAEAERLFLLGADKTKGLDSLKSMGIGLMADAAFALWKQGKHASCLLVLADVLDSLGNIPISDDIRIRHLHATIRHCISWIHFDARGEYSVNLTIPLSGMCSNQNPHEGIKDHRIVDISAIWELLASTERFLGLNIGIMERTNIVTGGKKPLVIEKYTRSIALEEIFKTNEFDNFVPIFIGMIEGVYHSNNIENRQEDDWEIIDIPKLPNEYWDSVNNWHLFYHCILAASIICTVKNKNNLLPIERWRTDLANADVLQDGVEQFLKVLSGVSPDNSIYQQAAAAIFKLRNGDIVPMELWKASFRLLNVFMNEKRWVEPALEKMLISRWNFAAHNQRFLFSTPSMICPEVEQYCFDQSCQGVSRIAAILDITAPYLNISISESAREMIKKIRRVKP